MLASTFASTPPNITHNLLIFVRFYFFKLLIILWSSVQVTHALPNTTHELFSKLFIHLLAESPWGCSELTSPAEKSRPQLLNGPDFIVIDQFLKVLVDTLHLHIQMDAGKSLVAFV